MVAEKVPCSLPRSVIFRHQLGLGPERQAACRSISSWSFATIFDGLDQVLNVSGMGGMGTSPNTATFASVFMAILRSRCGQHHCRPSSLGDGEAPTRAMELSPRGQAVKILGAAVEPHPAAVLDDLEPIVVEFQLMQPSVAFRDGFGGREDARARDEIAGTPRLCGLRLATEAFWVG